MHWREKDIRQEASARYIVGADGASSLVRQTFFPARHIRRYTAVQQWFTDTRPSPSYGCVFDSQNTDCYSWYLSKDGYWIFGGAYPQQNSRAHFENQKQKLAAHGFDFSRPLKTEACQVLRPSWGQLAAPARNGVFLNRRSGRLGQPQLFGRHQQCTDGGPPVGARPAKPFPRKNL